MDFWGTNLTLIWLMRWIVYLHVENVPSPNTSSATLYCRWNNESWQTDSKEWHAKSSKNRSRQNHRTLIREIENHFFLKKKKTASNAVWNTMRQVLVWTSKKIHAHCWPGLVEGTAKRARYLLYPLRGSFLLLIYFTPPSSLSAADIFDSIVDRVDPHVLFGI